MFIRFQASNLIEGLKFQLIAYSACFGHQSSVFLPKNQGNLATGPIVDNRIYFIYSLRLKIVSKNFLSLSELNILNGR